ncbi:MAG TPA: DUF1573 domain-containing protein [Lacipirellulaceae bacterium]|jgi:hypothetical protein|nr:DUF1573 domain-containing protein [Lacipirellulaceae bacterium]
MRIISIIFFAAIVGGLVGGAVAFVQVRNDLPPVTELPGGTVLIKPGAQEKMAKAKVEELHYDFGTMQRGTSKSHEFVIKNEGDAPLKLKAGTTSCKCTLSEVSESAIPPGESTKVKVQWTAKADNGPFRQTANIMTNDPLQSTIELTIDGKIMSASGVEPPDLVFDKIPVGESKTTQTFVMAMLQDDLTVTDPVLSDPTTRDHFDVKIEPVDTKDLPNKNARRGFKVSVTAKPGLPVGRIMQWLSLRTNLQDAEKLEVPISGQVVGDISVHGVGWNEERGTLMMGAVKSSEGGHARLSIVVRGTDAPSTTFTVKSVEPPEMKVKLGEPKKLKDTLVQVPLEIEIPAGTRPMVHLDTAQGEPGRIILSTTHPKTKELAVEVQFAVER